MSDHVAFLLQIGLILGAARLLGELFRRFGQPAVIGELLAGILLGRSLFGRFAHDWHGLIFTQQTGLEYAATIGLVLLMLHTGLETDIRVLRNLGRPAFWTAFFGFTVPFASGYFLGFAIGSPWLTSLFLATALAVSAMPVIAKILMDLNLLKRKVGILTLSSAIVGDTVGWILLAIIAGLVSNQGGDWERLLYILLGLSVFLAAARYVLYPLFRKLLPYLENILHIPGWELVVIVATAFLCAAATEAMHVHAVFGAFVAGMIFRQCPTLHSENMHRLEIIVPALFAPLFFALVGLQVDVFQVRSVGFLLVVFLTASLSKVAGCWLGGIIGRLTTWESISVGAAKIALGAMGLVAAKIAFDLKILDEELYAVVVLTCVATSFVAPLLLKPLVSKLPLSEEEQLQGKPSPSFLPTGHLRLLVPAGGGVNAILGCHLASHICQTDGDRCTALHVETTPGGFWNLRRAKSSFSFDVYAQRLRAVAGLWAGRLTVRRTPLIGTIANTILEEAGKGFNLLVIGASGHSHPVYDPLITALAKQSPCPLVVAMGPHKDSESLEKAIPFRRVLVPVDGSFASDTAFEFAAAYAESADAELFILYVSETRRWNPLLPISVPAEVKERDPLPALLRGTLRRQYGERLKRPERLTCLIRESETMLSGLLEEVQTGGYELVVLGAENRSLMDRLYLGEDVEQAVVDISCSAVLVIPKAPLSV